MGFHLQLQPNISAAAEQECISVRRLQLLLARYQHESQQPKSLLWRGIPLGMQSFCLTCAVFLILIVGRYRRQKEMKISKWRLLLTMLAGAILLYGDVVCQYFMPNAWRAVCIVEAWLRELGFIGFYGSIYLQIYWYYTQIQTRSAHLRLQLNERELLKILCIMLAVAVMYMAGWTAMYLELTSLAASAAPWCRLPRHDDISWACELLFILWTMYYAYKVRHVRSARPFVLALLVEMFVSSAAMLAVYTLRKQVHSDVIFIIMFVRCQLTVTLIIVLVLAPRMWRMHKPDPHLAQIRRASNQTAASSSTAAAATAADRRMLDVEGGHQQTPSQRQQQQRYVHIASDMSRLSDGNLIVSGEELAALPISEMDPEDIRAELKRVYTQMQMLRNKAMRKDNPHISKKRGGKRVAGTARRFSLQALNLRLHRDSSDGGITASTANHHSSQPSALQHLLLGAPASSLLDAARTPDKSNASSTSSTAVVVVDARRNSQEPHAMPTLWEEADREDEN